MIYLDYAANTPVDEEVLNTYVEATRKYIANPNSSHPLGKLAKEQIDESSIVIGKYFNTDPSNIIYTSGSSESNNLILKGIAETRKNMGNKIIISAVEHSSIVAPCNYLATHGYDVSVIPLTEEGLIDLEVLENELDDQTIIVSICAVDSELGTVQPLQRVVELVRKKYPNCIIHTDATQAIGKVEVDYQGIDFITFAPHKFFGLNGFGVLVNVNNNKLTPLIHGGKSTTIYRSGTPVTASVIACAKAFELATTKLEERSIYLKDLNTILRNELGRLSCVHINSPETTIPNTLNISLVGKDTKRILEQLEEHEIYLSTTTACALGSAPSKSVLAITGSEELASNTIRISISHLTSKEDLLKFINTFKELVGE